MLFWRHGPVETDQDALGAQAAKPGFPLRIRTLAACFPLRRPRSWSSGWNGYTWECFMHEIPYLLESYSDHHNCCHCFHGCWVVVLTKLHWFLEMSNWKFKNAKSQCGHVELKIMSKHMKLMTFTMELFMCVRDVIFVPHWLCINKQVNVWMWRQNKSSTHTNWFATSVMIVFRRFVWHDKLMFCLILSFPLFWFHRGTWLVFAFSCKKSVCQCGTEMRRSMCANTESHRPLRSLFIAIIV